jgi:phosphoesterase RecJ-like protein
MLTQDQQIFEQIKKAESILIAFRKTWDGDSVASGLAMYLFLKKMGKKADIAAEKFEQGNLFSFLPAYGEIKNSIENLRQFIISLDIANTKVGQIKYRVKDNTLNFIVSPKDGFFSQDDITSRSSGFKYDLIITLDTPDLESLGKIYDNDTEFFYQTTILNIDHHSGNEEFGQINLVDLNAVSTSEIVFSILEKYSRDSIDEDIATCLLAGMIAETRSFKTPNITPHALLAASQLISMGARREEIVNYLYRSRSMDVLKLWGRILARLSSGLDDRLVWSNLTYSDFTKTNTTANDLNEVIDELIVNIPKVKVIVIIYETIKNEKLYSNALVYSVKNIDALSLVKEYNPAGTKKIARLKTDKPREILEKEIIEGVKDKLSKLLIME